MFPKAVNRIINIYSQCSLHKKITYGDNGTNAISLCKKSVCVTLKIAISDKFKRQPRCRPWLPLE
jgi:hypothetical protein